MLKSIVMGVIMTSLIFLTACGGNVKQKDESGIVANTPTHNSMNNTEESQSTEIKPTNEANFKAELTINLKSYQDQMTESDLPSLEVLEANLTALVEHDHELFQSGFVNKRLAVAMEPYYGEQFQYKFTGIESIDQNLTNEHQVNITVIGQRLDTTTGTIEDVKMLYAIRSNDQGKWVIHTID